MKVIIAGGRDFEPKAIHVLQVKNLLLTNHSPEDLEVVSGKARGGDEFGELFAEIFDIDVKEYPADWDKHKKAAGHIRNRQMGDYADVLIAFWDGKSKGTKGMIDYMKSLDKPVRIIKY